MKTRQLLNNTNNMYTCSQCHKGVIVLNNEVIKACSCNASVIANATASMTGMGGVTI